MSSPTPDSTASPAPPAVFLSYAHEDAPAAQRIAEALRGFGVEVWFDQNELRGGDTWDPKIRKQIRDCTLFLAVVSASTQARREGYFRREWRLAVERTQDMAEGVPFLVPVVIDDTAESQALVPAEFLRVQWTRLPGGLPSPAFVEQIKRLLAPTAVMDVGRPRPIPRPEGVAPPARQPAGRRVPAAAWVAAIVVIGLAATWIATRQSPSPAAQPGLDSPAAAAAKADKSIAVLPFENLSDDKDNTAFFADGMHEDILTNLANIRDLRVVSRTSVMEYRGTKKKIPQIARELGVAYILEGSVRRAGSTVRITGQLIRAANDEHLWAKSYDRELTPKEVFSIQAALATEIAGALQAAISPETKKLLERLPTENLAAYDLFLKARALMRSLPSGQDKRAPLLQAAVELDPTFALAWAELAINHGYVFRDQDRTPARLALADAALARAVRLAPDAPDTVMARGYLAYLGHRDWPRATAEFERIIRLQPSNAEAIQGLATIQKRQGRWLDCVANIRKALQLDPGSLSTVIELTLMLAAGRRWDEAIAVYHRPGADPSERWRLLRQASLVRTTFSATGSTKAADDWLAGLTPAQLDDPWVISLRKWRANARDDYGEWQRLDALRSPDRDDGEVVFSRGVREAIDAAMVIAAHGDRAGARLRLGKFPADVRANLERDPANANLWSDQALMAAVLGQKTEALQAASKAVELMPESLDVWAGPTYRRTLAVVHAWVGDKDRALAELTHLLRVPTPTLGSVHDLRVEAAFAPLRGDPRFEALLKDPKHIQPLF